MIRKFRSENELIGTPIWAKAKSDSIVSSGLCRTRDGNRRLKCWKRPKAKTCMRMSRISKSWHSICNNRLDCGGCAYAVDYAHGKTKNHCLFETVLRMESGCPGRPAEI